MSDACHEEKMYKPNMSRIFGAGRNARHAIT